MQREAPPSEGLTLASHGDQFSPLRLTRHIPDWRWRRDSEDTNFARKWNWISPVESVSFLGYVHVFCAEFRLCYSPESAIAGALSLLRFACKKESIRHVLGAALVGALSR